MKEKTDILLKTSFLWKTLRILKFSLLPATKVNVPDLDYDLEWTPILESCMFGCESKTKHKKCMYRKEIELLCAQNLLIIIDIIFSQHNQGDVYDNLSTDIIFTLAMTQVFIRAPTIMRKATFGHNLKFLIISYQLHVQMFYILYEMGVDKISIHLRPTLGWWIHHLHNI
jgi:hypothetical protein